MNGFVDLEGMGLRMGMVWNLKEMGFEVRVG